VWRILTTLPVAAAADARDVVRCYRLRWRIEEVFRALKREGLGLEDTQVQDKERLFRLAVLALGAAVRIIQLVDARDGGPRPMSDVLDDDLQSAVALMVRSREGATERQKNPHPAGSLAWLSWVVARYGGWNSYYKPPGPKTMARGWERFSATLTGIILAKDEALP
ncbi:MAG: transposase, partial [Caulobacteraceae bacterium]